MTEEDEEGVLLLYMLSVTGAGDGTLPVLAKSLGEGVMLARSFDDGVMLIKTGEGVKLAGKSDDEFTRPVNQTGEGVTTDIGLLGEKGSISFTPPSKSIEEEDDGVFVLVLVDMCGDGVSLGLLEVLSSLSTTIFSTISSTSTISTIST